MKKYNLLIADDEAKTRDLIADSLQGTLFDVDKADNGIKALDLFREKRHAIVITDLRMPGKSGMEVLQEVKALKPEAIVLMITAFGSTETAVSAMKMGAHDFLLHPLDIDELEVKLRKALETLTLLEDNRNLRDKVKNLWEIVGTSDPIQQLRRKISQSASSDETVLITGETGTGKEIIAHNIHDASQRKNNLFLPLNCGSISENLMGSELFGHEKGAFTGADKPRPGIFEEAAGGTVFLDEIDKATDATQVNLLRVLQEKKVKRVGSNKEIPVDFRVIAATSKNLEKLISENRFRSDLFFRLNVLPVRAPRLVDHAEDIPLLMDHFIRKHGYTNACQVFEQQAINFLKNRTWPGNVRELENIMVRARILFSDFGKRITMEQASLEFGAERHGIPSAHNTSRTLKEARQEFERGYIMQVLGECKGNIAKAAERLDLARQFLHQKLNDLGIENIYKDKP